MINLSLSTSEFLDLYSTTTSGTLRAKLEQALKDVLGEQPDDLVKVRCYSFGDNQLSLIKIIREYTKMGLKEAKDCSEGYDWMMQRGDAKRMITQVMDTIKEADVGII
jgi:ribosomal protein L7/L12